MLGLMGRVWAASVMLLAGCYPATELQRPRVVKAGELQVALGLRVQEPPRWLHFDPVEPAPELGVRVGVARGVDVGLRLASGLEVGTKVQLFDDPELALAIAPAAAWSGDHDSPYTDESGPAHDADVLMLRLPIFAGWRAGKHVEIWGAPSVDVGTYVDDLDDARSGGSSVALLRCALGIDLKVSSWLTLQPQIAMFAPLIKHTLTDPYTDSGDRVRLSQGDNRFAFALNFFFDTGDD